LIVIQILLGLGLFLFGKTFLSNQFRYLTNRKARQIIARWTQHPFTGFLCGASIVSLTQSATATSVLITNMVRINSIDKRKAIPVFAGAGICSGFTILIVTFHIFPMIMLLMGISGILYSSSDNEETKKYIGILVGLGIVLYGLHILQTPSAKLANSEWFKEALNFIKNEYFLEFMLGTLISFIFHSSILPAILLIAVGKTGLYGLDDIAMGIYGAILGSGLLTIVNSLKTQGEAKQLSSFQILYRLLGTGICVSLFYAEIYLHIPLLNAFAQWVTKDIAFQTIILYFAINIIPAILLWVFSDCIFKIMDSIWPETLGDIYSKPKFLVEYSYTDPFVEFDLIEKEQLRVLTSLNEYFDIIRKKERISKIDELVKANLAIEKIIKAELFEIPKYNQLTTEEYEWLNLLLIKMYAIEEICKTTADMSRLFIDLMQSNVGSAFVSTATEGIHALVLSLLDIVQSGSQMDIDFFRKMLSNQQNTGITKLRKAYISVDSIATQSEKMKLLVATTNCELLIFLIKDLSEKYNIS
jgi:phosphate:Na+ symporter